MENNRIVFSHFENEKGDKLNSIKISLGNLNINEWLDDVEAEMKIYNGDINFLILDQNQYDQDDLKGIQTLLSSINWHNGYEFLDLYDIDTNKKYYIIGNINSDAFNMINSPKNTQNLKGVSDAINLENLKEYCVYIVDNYIKMNKSYKDSEIYYNLMQFVEEGRIKDLIEEKDDISLKTDVINIFVKNVNSFAKDLGIDIVLSYSDFLNSETV